MTRNSQDTPRGAKSPFHTDTHLRVMQQSDPRRRSFPQPARGRHEEEAAAVCDGIICQTCQGDRHGATVARPNEASRNSSAKHVDDLSGPLHPD